MTCAGAVDGNRDLVLAFGGATSFSSTVGFTNAIGDGGGPALTINSTGTTTFSSTLETQSGITQANGAGTVTFQDNVTIAAGDTATTLNGDVTFNGLSTFDAGRSVDFGNTPCTDAMTLSAGPVAISTTANDGDLTFDSTIDGAVNLTLTTNGAGQIYLNCDVGGGTNLTQFTANTDTINLAANADIDTSATDGTITFHVDGQVLGGYQSINAGAGTFKIYPLTSTFTIELAPTDSTLVTDVFYDSDWTSVTADNFIVGDATHTGTIHMGSDSGITAGYHLDVINGGTGDIIVRNDYDSSVFGGDLTINSGSGEITVGVGSAVDVALGTGVFTASDPVTLNNDCTIGATGDIIFSSTVDGGSNLGLTAGGADVVFTGAVGGGTRLGAMTIVTARHVGGDNADPPTANAVVTSASVDQNNGTGTTRFGALDTNAAGGIDINTSVVILNGTVTTTNNGPVTITNGGQLTIAASADMILDGAFDQDGAGAVSTGGDITTTNDAIGFDGAVTLTDNVALSSGGAGGGNISFASTLIGTGVGTETLGITAGTGSLTFSDAVGATQLGAVTVNSASGGVTASSTFSAVSLSIANGGAVDLNDTVTVPSGFSSAGTTFDNSGASITLRTTTSPSTIPET